MLTNIKVLIFCAIVLTGLVPSLVLAQTNSNANVEATVREWFSDSPEMITIAKCESGYRQFTADGSVLRGGTGGNYIGIFQISSAHAANASNRGLDINTIDGNVRFARYMYQASGTTPWKSCLPASAKPAPVPPLQPTVQPNPTAIAPVATPVAVSGSLTANLNVGMTNPQVLVLQQILNKSGYTVSTSGVGSPGQETTFFGSLTREAVKKFQCAQNITCSGNESTTGYGRVGPMTRAKLNQTIGQ